METLTWINQMFFLYFAVDFVIGNMETYFLFQLYRDRSIVFA